MFFKNILTVICSVALTLLIAEGVLRLLPVNESIPTMPVNEEAPTYHFKPNTTSTWSRFADFAMVNKIHSNNYGFINDQDYAATDPRPLLAIIGDSYVEAAMVPYPKTIQGKLAKELDGWRVYSFGASGAPLSQYLQYARYTRKTFHPKKMAFVIIANDYDESITRYKFSPGFHFFQKKDSGELELIRKDYSPSWLSYLVRNSRLMMYLLSNANLPHRIRSIFHPAPINAVGQTSAKADSERLSLSKTAVDRFLELLPKFAGLPPQDIFLIVDGLRPHLYSEEGRTKAKGSYADLMRNYFIQRSTEFRFQVIDMQKVFLQDFTLHGKHFEFERDGHWNARGHGVAATALMERWAASMPSPPATVSTEAQP